jgi:hypothetical protein
MRSMRQALAPGALVVLVALGLVAAGPAPPARPDGYAGATLPGTGGPSGGSG